VICLIRQRISRSRETQQLSSNKTSIASCWGNLPCVLMPPFLPSQQNPRYLRLGTKRANELLGALFVCLRIGRLSLCISLKNADGSSLYRFLSLMTRERQAFITILLTSICGCCGPLVFSPVSWSLRPRCLLFYLQMANH
jgi:hypothetical protein